LISLSTNAHYLTLRIAFMSKNHFFKYLNFDINIVDS